MGRAYRCLSTVYRVCSRKMKAEWAVPFTDEPSVFVVNHAGAYGPMDMCTKFPLKDNCLIWCNDGMCHADTVPAYVRQDYWWKPGCWAEPLLNATLPNIAAAVVPPVLNGAPIIPVYHDNRVLLTARKTLRALKDGKHVVIFPEQPSGWKSHHMWINTGFLFIGEQYAKLTGKALKFWPVHLDRKARVFRIAAPISYDLARSLEEQKQELADKLAAGLRGE